MLDLIRLIAELVSKVAPAAASVKKKQQTRRLGVDLYLLYLSLNKVLVAGDDVVSTLEQCVEAVSRSPVGEFASPDVWLTRRLSKQLEEQQYNLVSSMEMLRVLSGEYAILSPEATRAIYTITRHKNFTIEQLMKCLPGPRLMILDPLGAVKLLARARELGIQYDIEAMLSLEASGSQTHVRADAHALAEMWNEAGGLEDDDMVRILISERSIEYSVSWGAKEYELVIDYLENRRPREVLDELAAALKLLNSALEKHFTVSDILLAVREAQAMPEF